MGGEKSLHKAKYQEGSWPRQYLTINTEVLCRTTCPNFLWNLQPLSHPMQSPYLLQVIHHHSSSPKTQSLIPEWLSTCCPYIHCHDGVWATDSLLDPHQFTYRANRSVEDAICLCLHHVLKHLDCPNTYARILFIDYSSVFHTIIPHKLFNKLRLLNGNTQMGKWMLDFLLNRTQVVKFNSQLSQGSDSWELSLVHLKGVCFFPYCSHSSPMTAGPVAAPLWHSSSEMIPPLKDW